ncbi:MAG TPA: hypothetical protein VN688_01865 [Gemmataceae bacterium]|nr:hypothetical protein [Gemmataceae bacterium]
MNTEARPIVEATGVPLAGVTITAAHLVAVVIQGLAAEAITPTPELLIVVRLMAADMVSPRIAVRLMVLATMPLVVMAALVAANRVIAAIMPVLAARIMAPHAMRSRGADTAEVIAVTPNGTAATVTASTLALVVMAALVAANTVIAAITPVLAARIMGPRARRSRGADTAEVIAVTVLAIRDVATDARRSAVDSGTTDVATRPRDIVVTVADTAIRAMLAPDTGIKDSAVAVINTVVGATVPASIIGTREAISPTTIA